MKKIRKESIFKGLTWDNTLILTGIIMMATTLAVHINYKLGTCISYFNCNLSYFGTSFIFLIAGFIFWKYSISIKKRKLT